MGWLWSSKPDDDSAEKSVQPGSASQAPRDALALSEEQRLRILGHPEQPSTPAHSSRERQADTELEDLIRQFEATDSTRSENTALPAQDQPEPTQSNRILPDGSWDITPDRIYPRTMSCRQQFDQAFYCQSLGGKFNDIYRYGHLQSCSEQWSAFWFCMRNRTLSGHQKEEVIKNFYRERDERRKKEHGSSEDVWELRTKAVEKAFWKDSDADDASTAIKE